MPCYSIQTTSVDLGKVQQSLLVEALQSLGLNPVVHSLGVRWNGGELRTGQSVASFYGSNAEQAAKQIKAAYAGVVTRVAFAKAGWKVQQVAQVQQVRR